MSTPGLGAEAMPEQGTSTFLNGLHFVVIRKHKGRKNNLDEEGWGFTSDEE